MALYNGNDYFLYYLYIFFFPPFIYFFAHKAINLLDLVQRYSIYIFIQIYMYIFLFLDFECTELPLYLGERFPFCLDQKEDHENHAQRADQREEEENRCHPDSLDHARERHGDDKRQYPVEQCCGRGSGPL